MRALSADAKKEIFASKSGAAFLSVLKISHSTIDTVYLVNNSVNIALDGDVYTAYAFKYTPPSEKEGGVQKGKLILPNIDRDFIAKIRSIDTPLSVSAALVMVLPNGAVSKEAGWWLFSMKNISYDALTISGELSYGLEFGNNVSIVKYNNLNFPAIYS